MQLITLNIWAGSQHEELVDFFRKTASETDVYCLQEVFDTPTELTRIGMVQANIFKIIQDILGDQFVGHFAPTQSKYVMMEGPTEHDLSYGLATFTRKNIEILEQGDIFVYRERDGYLHPDRGTLPRNLQYTVIPWQDSQLTIANFHGLWYHSSKDDNQFRLDQSRKVKAFLDARQGAKILCGDFNLLPETESLSFLEEGMKNLIKEYGVTSTRSSLYTKTHRYADYILVSPEINVQHFEVLPDEVSDHLPLKLDWV